MTMSSSSIIMANVKLLPLQAQTLAGALLQGLQTGVGATAAPGLGKFPQLLHPATFKPMMYAKLPMEDYRLLPGSLSELMQDRNFMRGDFIRLVPSVVRRAKGVLSGVKKRGQAQGDMMDKATEYALLPGILREAFAIELEKALSASLAGTLALRRLLQSPVALPGSEGAGLEYLTEDAIGFCVDVARGTSRSDCVVVPDFLGDARWGELLDKDARRLFETELKLKRDDLRTSEELGSKIRSKHAREESDSSRAPALGLKALKASNHGCLVARSFLPARLQDAARTHLPAVSEALERLAALPCEINAECDECDGEAAGAATGAGLGQTGDRPTRSDGEGPAGKPEADAGGKLPAPPDDKGRQSPRFLSLLHGACSLFAVRGPSLPASSTGSPKSGAGVAAGVGAGASHGSELTSAPSHLRVLKLGTPPYYRGEELLGVGRCACLYAATGLRVTVRLTGGVTSGSGASKSASGDVGPVRHLDLKPDSLLLYSPETSGVVVSVPSSDREQMQARASASLGERAPSMSEDGKDSSVAGERIARDSLHVGLSCTLFVKPSKERLASMMKSMMAGGL